MAVFTKEYSQGLTLLDMFYSEPIHASGLIHVLDLDNESRALSYSQRHALERAKQIGANAVYFRNFPDNSRPSIPLIYIFDFTSEEQDVVELHKKVWSSSEVRLYLIITKTEVRIFNSSKPVKLNAENKLEVCPLEVLGITGEAASAYEKYSAKRFDNGTFWEESLDDFGYKETAYEKLIAELKHARANFLKDISLDKEVANKLLVLGILVKYLEERVDVDEFGRETKVFPQEFFYREEFGFSKNFIEVIRNGYIIKLYDYLSRHFNGRIFHLNDGYKEQISSADLTPLANFLSGDIDNHQYVLWRLYSFSHLPIELISSIYEMFLEADKNSGIAYTPSYLVNFMIDECMPLENPSPNFKVLDPACGSGIFLVSAYKRLIDWWRINRHQQTGKWVKPDKEDLEELKEILRSSIYGVDIEGEAVDLSIFSLSLTLCDMLSPKVIWENLRFDDLSENILKSDFFEWYSNNTEKRFDLVIGNPPFIEYGSKCPAITKNISLDIDTPNNQSALLFTSQAIKLVEEKKGLLAFVLPAGPLLYNNSDKAIDFRRWLLGTYNVPQIIDFTYLSGHLFKNKGNEKNVAVATFFLENKAPDEDPIYHITVKKLKAAKERQYFEIDHYDFHKVTKSAALSNIHVWKTNLLGGGRLTNLIDNLRQLPSLGDFLKTKVKEGWAFGEGFIKGKDDDFIKPIEIASGKYKIADYITGKEFLPTEAFDQYGIDYSKIDTYTQQYFYRSAHNNRNIFKAPHILIKENIGHETIPIAFVENNLTFKHEIIGIHCPEKEKEELVRIKDRFLNNQLYRFFLLTTSGRAGISRSTSTVLKNDIMSLPYPEYDTDIELSEYEQMLVDDTLNYSLEFLGKDKNVKLLQTSSENELTNFGSIFCKVLNSLFEKKGRRYFQESIFRTDSFFVSVFCYGDSAPAMPRIIDDTNFEKHLESLIYEKTQNSYRINRIVKVYDEDKIYLLKPKDLRYWLKSIALQDADETIVDLYNAGY